MLSFQKETAQGESRQMHNLDSPTEHLLSLNLLPFWEYRRTHLKDRSISSEQLPPASSSLALVCPLAGHVRGDS